MIAPDLSALGARFRQIAGPDAVLESPALRLHGARPALRVSPASVETLAACLGASSELGAAISPLGGGTQQRVGIPPSRLDVVLETSRISSIVEWEPADLTACIQAGASLADVQSRLATAGQQLAIDAPLGDRASLGGLIATNVCGPRRWLYGSWRDQIIGMQMVLSSGEVIKSGGRVVKNVQGYDLAKLFIGSLGTLGVITQVNVRVTPIPPERRLFVAHGTAASVCAFFDGVASSALRVATLDLLDGKCGLLCDIGSNGWLGAVLIEGARAVVQDQIDRLRSLASLDGLQPEVFEEPALGSIWQSWLNLGRTDDLGDGEALLCISTRPSEVLMAASAVVELAQPLGMQAQCWARAGTGTIYGRVASSPASARTTIPQLQREMLARWPWTALIAGNPDVARASEPWGAQPPGLELMRRLKHQFDKSATLQLGRFVGGI